VINLDKGDFIALQKLAKALLEEQTDYPDDTLKQIIVSTPYAGVNIFLSIEELRRLNNLLEEAENEITALEILSLFGGS